MQIMHDAFEHIVRRCASHEPFSSPRVRHARDFQSLYNLSSSFRNEIINCSRLRTVPRGNEKQIMCVSFCSTIHAVCAGESLALVFSSAQVNESFIPFQLSVTHTAIIVEEFVPSVYDTRTIGQIIYRTLDPSCNDGLSMIRRAD